MARRVYFRNKWLPWVLLTPQLAVTLVFFIWPAFEALLTSFFVEDAFTGARRFVAFKNFIFLLEDPVYLGSFGVTLVFTGAVTLLVLSISLLLAVKADKVIRGPSWYRAVLTWPYAVAPAVAGILWVFMFNPTVGLAAAILDHVGVHWNYNVNGVQAMLLMILAASWRQIAYNFLFFIAALQAIPQSLIEAASIDGASRSKRFWTVTFPLLTPTTFFLLVIDILYALFETFGLIDAVTQGGPSNATNILVYEVYQEGFVGQNLGGSAAQSVILMLMVVIMTFVQFRFVERGVNYE